MAKVRRLPSSCGTTPPTSAAGSRSRTSPLLLSVSTLQAVPPARFHLRAQYDALRGEGPRRDTRMDAQALHDLAWWKALGTDASVGQALCSGPPLGEVTTDASPYGWGATFQRLVSAHGFFRPDVQDEHINIKELSAVRLAILTFSYQFLPCARLAVRTDSRATMGVLNAMCSWSPRLMAEVRRLHALLQGLGLFVRASWLPTLSNAHADRLSRDRDRSDWWLCPALCSVLTTAWGACTIDWFATLTNTQLPRYNSRALDPSCEAVDAWQQPKAGEANVFNPPFSQAALAVLKIAVDKADAIAILPVWRAQPWWSEARARADTVCFLPTEVVHYTHEKDRVAAPNPAWTTAAFLFRLGGRIWPPAAGTPVCEPTSWAVLAATPRRHTRPTCSCRPSSPTRRPSTTSTGANSRRSAPRRGARHCRPHPLLWSPTSAIFSCAAPSSRPASRPSSPPSTTGTP